MDHKLHLHWSIVERPYVWADTILPSDVSDLTERDKQILAARLCIAEAHGTFIAQVPGNLGTIKILRLSKSNEPVVPWQEFWDLLSANGICKSDVGLSSGFRSFNV